MGFNIAGLVIDNNFDKDLSKLSDALHLDLEVVEEITFETASKNWTEEGDYNVYFSKNATMVFFPHELAINKYHVDGLNSLCYAYSATAMAFLVSHLDSEGNYRFIMEADGEKNWEEGTPLQLEKDYPTSDGLIFKLFDDLLGENFHELDFEDLAYRCKKADPKVNKTTRKVDNAQKAQSSTPKMNQSQVQQMIQDAERTFEKVATKQKRWWEFWK